MGELRRIYKVRGLDVREGRKVVLAAMTRQARDRMAARLRDEGYEVVVWED